MSDLIEREDAIKALRVAYFDKRIQSAKDDPCVIDAMTDWAIRQIKAIPSARPKGEWVEREVFEDAVINEWQSARCSECAKYHTTPYMYYFDNFNFCPNCGADMRGERADEHGQNKSADRQ